MDTSDSEYFESADEDIHSDDEICEKKEKKSSDSRNIDVKHDENIDNSEIEAINEQEIEKLQTNIDHVGIEDKSSESKLIREEKESNDNKQLVTVEAKSEMSKDKEMKQDKPVKKSRSNIKSKLGSKISKASVNFEKTPEKTSAAVAEIKERTEEEKSAKDENLWDDEELDWGLEERVDQKSPSESGKAVPSSRQNNSRLEEKSSESWGGWSTWGVSVLSSAGQSVSSITSQLTNVIESGLGAVDPEELAKINREEKRKLQETLGENYPNNETEVQSAGFRLGNLVKLVENTGTKVISGGLDTLETIGKKTMEVLQEGDPGLKKKRAFLKIEKDKPVLSQILREAKERAENEPPEETYTKKTKNYETLFDDHQGLVHLEALELLSKQCEIKLKNIENSYTGQQYTEFLETMEQIKELCELPDEEEEEQSSLTEIKEKLNTAVAEMNVQISCEKLVTNWEETEIWLSTLSIDLCDEKELHQQAIETLAQVTSMAMEQFHKIGELVLIKDHRSTADEADSLVQITTTLISLIGIVAAKFSEKLNCKVSQSGNKEVSELITNVFFEAANSSSYVQDALQLLIPVLQVGAI